MTTRIRKRHCALVALGVIALALAVGGAGATAALEAAVDDGVVKACRHKSGVLLIPSAGKTCKRSEQALSWNVKGPAGPAGPAGVDGKDGAAGPPARRATPGRAARPGRQARPGLRGRQGLPVRAGRSLRSRR